MFLLLNARTVTINVNLALIYNPAKNVFHLIEACLNVNAITVFMKKRINRVINIYVINAPKIVLLVKIFHFVMHA